MWINIKDAIQQFKNLFQCSNLFGNDKTLNLDEYDKKRVQKIGLITLNICLISFIIYYPLKFYIQSIQEPICNQRNLPLDPIQSLFNTIVILTGIIIAIIILLGYFKQYSLIYYIGYIPQNRYISTYFIKLISSILLMFIFANIICYFFQGKYVFSYQISQYSLCNKMVVRGKQQEDLMLNGGQLIDTDAVHEIQQIFMNSLKQQKNNRFITYVEGNSGIGKSTAIRNAVNRLLNSNKQGKQILFYYNNYQTLQCDSKDLFQFKSNFYNIDIGKHSFLKLSSYISDQTQSEKSDKNDKKTFKQVSQQFFYLGQRAKIVIIFDGVNEVKDNQHFLIYLKFFAKLFKTHLDFHLFLCSSQSGLQSYYDSKHSFLRQKDTKTKVVAQLNKSQLEKLFDNLVIKSNLSNKLKDKLIKQKNEIVNLSYGFKELKNILSQIKQKIQFSNVDKILKQLKTLTYINQIKKIIPSDKKDIPFTIENAPNYITQNDKTAICLILQSNPQKFYQNVYNVQKLKDKNILFSQQKFYSKIIQVSFRENFKSCQQKSSLISKEIQQINYQQKHIKNPLMLQQHKTIEEL